MGGKFFLFNASWWSQLMSGADNRTPAIGRYLGALLFLTSLLVLPTLIVAVLVLQKVTWSIWERLLMTLPVYVTAMVASVIGLITLTNRTEPKVADQ